MAEEENGANRVIAHVGEVATGSGKIVVEVAAYTPAGGSELPPSIRLYRVNKSAGKKAVGGERIRPLGSLKTPEEARALAKLLPEAANALAKTQ